MNLALECPTALLSEFQPLADFDFILAHLVLKDEEYAEFYSKSKRWKILDNSCNELLHPVSLDELEKAAEIVKPDYIMSPDFLGDHFSTEKSLDKAIERFGWDKVYPIIQGHEFRYALECAEYIAKLGFDRVAVPYDLTKQRSDSLEDMADRRIEVVSRLIILYDFKCIHLLGMTTLEELKSYQRIEQVKSIDTGSPVMHGLRSIRFGQDKLLPKDKPTMELMETTISVDPEYSKQVMYYNIGYLRRVLNGAR